ncbi:4-hydroxythreonine-4-phosphate dehydrogenase PdxA [Porphyromonas levii]|uniref:4-hydroxythreonine-4-phosphate dehydrogenase PdxA n=1 Tax=Porphyromonas levii TaxID=28114 RepID=A0A4Y8WQY1_9PORP|nr:4-hydroxythreonine-4-phosphate dehydrogenase PdxA [Porphyromonas levii]MBR8702444.1 D-threonate 4-phosphate dehydrogenase [Porphyromonas levii]MBR8713425.1 D-threonate 4-phosphate dehydrogenase [Porphyromonas levii]MBR8715438.1 D-threonate 4-phosphate dehydrogenase [Porphyromonas levii]MBR8727963.1 D-threonate 4-phosphate dehydrogenase [Porphyromonas levii]MBR8729178.1 D-threonate 4-phosphate dehydrogenase [Porphyromonas levii]
MSKIKIGITHGDFNGIGYEVILKTLVDDRCVELFTPVLYCSSQALSYYKKGLGINVTLRNNIVKSAADAVEGELNIVEVNTDGGEVNVSHGAQSALAGKLAERALVAAREDLLRGTIDAVVTAPINKEVMGQQGFPFVGHTDFFAEPFRGSAEPMMLFAADEVKVALLTIHMPLREVPQYVTKERVLSAISAVEHTMQQDFGVEKPRIAVLGLNPHAGENGLLGHEEVDVIAPAVSEAWTSGYHVFGPFAADGFWGSGNYRQFDVVLSMYHDQGLLPFKLLAMDEGVNITCGLPIIRTSPDHGTAFDISGKGIAKEVSFRNAIYRAIDIHRNRVRYRETTAHPLQKQYVERGKDNVRLDLSKSDDEL